MHQAHTCSVCVCVCVFVRDAGFLETCSHQHTRFTGEVGHNVTQHAFVNSFSAFLRASTDLTNMKGLGLCDTTDPFHVCPVCAQANGEEHGSLCVCVPVCLASVCICVCVSVF